MSFQQAMTMAQKFNLLDFVKKFHGRENENVSQWFERNQVILEMAGASDEAAKLIPLFLENTAYATWSELAESVKSDLQEIRKEF